ncbi:TonB-dependent receptor [Aridibaculum aurantiacum]|uniref:TonB-dependent receptor n=1 Tax=Aridibaculum aurantiacum TaxID=2810307 RepID=UPI001F61EB1E|nr:TonB-dependent receptor [Aridibaculum aurantiacum]
MSRKLTLTNRRQNLPSLAIRILFIFLLAFSSQVSAKGFSQDRLSISFKNAEISKVLAHIEKQTTYRFLYNESLQGIKQKVNLSLQDADIKQALDVIFSGTGLSYRFMENNLVVIREEAGTSANLPDIPVTGKVTGGSGEAVAGVSITVKGSTRGTSTDAQGNYSLVVPDNAILVVSAVGFSTQEIEVNNRRTINIQLAGSTTQLEQVVVVGYGTQRKRDLTGSITSISGNEIAKQPNVNPVASLQGKVAGLTIVNSGRAGAQPTVRIRGVNSTNNTDPLYVVDGVFQTNIDYINPGDIESMEVLRDPSSLAIFGLQGGNGVIIITTKRAARGTTRVSFQSTVGVQVVQDKIALTDAEGFKRLYSAQLANINAQPFDFRNYTANTNWQDLIFRDAIINNNTMTISTSGEKGSTLVSLGYNVQEGVLRNDKYQRFVARLNQEIRVNQNIRVGGDLNGTYWKRNNAEANITNALWAAPIVPVRSPDGLYYTMPSFQRAQVGNPVARLDRFDGTDVIHGVRAVGSLFGEIKFLKNFTWRSAFLTDLSFNINRGYNPLPFQVINLGEGTAPTDTFYDRNVRTSVTQGQSEFRKFQQDHTLTFDRSFTGGHKITALVGFTTLFNGSSSLSGTRRDTGLNVPNDPNFWYLNIISPNNPTTNAGGGNAESFMSYLARVNYSFGNKYLVNASFRRDGSSKFAPTSRWGNFGSIGVGWVISEESFYNFKAINFLKLRGAWGTVGAALGFPANLFRPGLTTANVGVFGDNVYGSVAPAYVPDPNLRWEKVRGVDLGLDFRALANRLNGELTFYDRTTVDILTTVTLPGAAGNYNYRTNLGTISNRGVELSLGWNDRIGRDWTYRLGGNISYNKNNVESIGNNINFQILGNAGANRTVTGQSIGHFFGYQQVGIYQSVADLNKRPSFVNSLPGDIAYQDTNGDGIIDQNDRTYLGTPFPLYNFGASFGLGYKGFDFLVEGQGVAGNKIYAQRRTETFATLNYEVNRLNAWTVPGTSNVEPIMDNTRGNNFLFSSYFLEPGDYFRIRTLQVGYTFTPTSLRRLGMSQLRMFLSGQNIATFTKATGYTPEASLGNPVASGADNGTYPVPAVYSFGVNVTF